MIITTKDCIINTDDISAVFTDYEEETMDIVFKSGAKYQLDFLNTVFFSKIQKNIKKQRSEK